MSSAIPGGEGFEQLSACVGRGGKVLNFSKVLALNQILNVVVFWALNLGHLLTRKESCVTDLPVCRRTKEDRPVSTVTWRVLAHFVGGLPL